MSDHYESVHVNNLKELNEWLLSNHATSPGAWLVRWKRDARDGGGYISYPDLVQELLVFGWIDSRARTVDQERTSCLITPRRPGSAWSKVNKEHIASLTASGRLQPAGRAAVDSAMADGSWNRLDQVEQLLEPEDLRRALDATPEARRHWDGFPRSSKRAILEWIAGAKRAETRARRIEETVDEAAAGRRANHWRPVREAPPS